MIWRTLHFEGSLGIGVASGVAGGATAPSSPMSWKKWQKNFSSQMSKVWNHTMCYKKTAVTIITDLPSLPHLADDTRIWVFSPTHPPHDENLPHYPNYDESLFIHLRAWDRFGSEHPHIHYAEINYTDNTSNWRCYGTSDEGIIIVLLLQPASCQCSVFNWWNDIGLLCAVNCKCTASHGRYCFTKSNTVNTSIKN